MPVEAAPPAPALFCITCGYNQHGISSTRCPECGQDFSIVPPSATRLPWAHRRHLGLLGAYWRTVMMILFRPQLFWEQIDNPITLKDARIFWLLTVLLAYIPILGGVIQIYYTPLPPRGIIASIQFMFVSSYMPLPIGYFMLVGLFFLILFATGMPSYLCNPKGLPIERQNRAVALSYFTCAPLGLMPLLIALIVIAQLMQDFPPIALALRIASGLLAVVMLGRWSSGTARIIMVLGQRSDLRQTRMLLMGSWLFLIFVCLAALPFALWYICLMCRIIFSFNAIRYIY